MNETQNFADLQDAGNAQAQLILQAIARHANWDTGECWPGQEAIARMSKCTVRTVRTYLARLEADGFITRQERRDDLGNRQNELITLVGYKEWISALREGGKVAKPKAVDRYETSENVLPENLSARKSLPEKNASLPEKNGVPTGKQASGTKEPSLNSQTTKSARAREVNKFDFGSEGAKPSKAMPTFLIQPADTSWHAWLDHFRATGQSRCAAEAERSKRIRVSTRWPSTDSHVFEPAQRSAPSAERGAA